MPLAGQGEKFDMSMDKSLKRSGKLVRQRSVLTRAERISQLVKEERWVETSRPVGLPKVKVMRAILKKAKKAAKDEEAEGVVAEGAAAAVPAAGGKAPAGKTAPAGAKPAAAKPAAAKPAAGGKGGAKAGGKG